MQTTILDALQRRYATKRFDRNKKISEQDIHVIEESLRLAPSSYGLQAWNFLRIDTVALREQLFTYSNNQSQVVDASHLYVLCHRSAIHDEDIERYLQDIIKKRRGEREQLQRFFDMIKHKVLEFDAEQLLAYLKSQIYIAAGFMMETCALLEVDCCPMEGFDHDIYDDILGLTETWYRSALVIPVGYRDASDPYIQKKKVRYDYDEVFDIR